MAYLFDVGIFNIEGVDGGVMVGAKLHFYASGTTTPITTYTTNALSVANANPVVAAADGRFGPIWIAEPVYKIVLKTAADVTLVTRDPIVAPGIAERTAAEIAASVTPTSYAWPELDIRRYGADMTGVADGTAALQAAVNVLKTSPVGAEAAGWGYGTIVLPKGILRINSGITAASLLGFILKGQGQHSTYIKYYSDTVPLFDVGAYSAVTIEDLTVMHVATGARGTWTNALIKSTGVGGGQRLHLNRVMTHGFHRIIWLAGTANQDTTFVTFSRFEDCTAFLYSRNTQAVINTFIGCTWAGEIASVFDIAATGHTRIADANVVVTGSLLKLYGQAAVWGGTAQFLLENVKQEFHALSGTSDSKIQELDGDKKLVLADLRLINCGISGGGFSPTAGTKHIECNPSMRIDLEGGNYDSVNLATYSSTIGAYTNRRTGIYVRGTLTAPHPDNVIRTVDAGGGGQPTISWKGNNGVHDCVMGGTGGNNSAHYQDPVSYSVMSGQNGQFLSTGSGGQTFDLDFYGQQVVVEAVDINVVSTFAGDLIVNIYPTSADRTALSNLIEAVTVPSALGRTVWSAGKLKNSATYDPGNLVDAAGVTTTVTVTGAALGDKAEATFSLDIQGITVNAWVSAANTVSVRLQNESGGALDLASGTLRVFVTKSGGVVDGVYTDGLYFDCVTATGARANISTRYRSVPN